MPFEKIKFEDKNIGRCVECGNILYVITDEAFDTDRKKAEEHRDKAVEDHRCPGRRNYK